MHKKLARNKCSTRRVTPSKGKQMWQLLRELFASDDMVVVELQCSGLARTVDVKRGLEKVRRQLSGILRSLAPDNAVSARIDGDRFVLSFDRSNREDVSNLLRRIQGELSMVLGSAGFAGRVSLEIGDLSEEEAMVSELRGQTQTGFIHSIRSASTCLN